MIRTTGLGAAAPPRRDGVWPRVYRMQPRQRRLYRLLGGIVAVAGVAGAIALASSGPRALALVPLAFTALGAYLLAAVRAERIVLYEDAVEVTSLGKGTRRLRRDELVGLRWVPLQYGQRQLVLELRGGRKPYRLGWVHETDAVLDGWLAAIPDLDARDRARAEAELLHAPELGRTEAERRLALERARKVARALNAAAMAACGWAWLFPRPYPAAIVVLGVLPLAAIAVLLAGRGRYAFEPDRNDPRPSLAVAVMGPGLVLGMRGLLDLHVLDWRPLVAGAAAGGAALAAVIAAGDRRSRRRWLFVLLWPLLSFHPWGALTLANALLDRAAPEVFEVTVRGKHVSGGKHTSYDLVLDPWGPVRDPGAVDVGRRLYQATPVGGLVCVALRPGALGARWYVVARCG